MNFLFSMKNCIPGVAIAALLFTGIPQAALVTVSSPGRQIGLNETFSIDLSLSGLGQSEQLGGFELAITYDPDILEFISFTPDERLDAYGFITDAMSNDAGRMDIAGIATAEMIDGQPATFTLGSVTLRGIGVGESAISLADIVLCNGDGSAFIAAEAGPAASASVPEPATVPLMACGLIGLMALVRKK